MTRRNLLILLTLLAVMLAASPAAAVSTVDCHCFRDREFSPENPVAYDPYLLATVQNRLLGYAFDLPRKEIVSMKMAGARGDQLWVAHWAAQASSRPVGEVQAAYAKTFSWAKTLAALSVPPETLGASFRKALADDDEAALAWAVVAQVSASYASDPESFAALKQSGATLKEAILASILAELKGVPAVSLLELAITEGQWGGQLVSSRLSVESIDSFLKERFSS